MHLAKPDLDFGLVSNRREEQAAFWSKEAGFDFDQVIKLGGGIHQLRYKVNGSIVKVNHSRDSLPEAPPGTILRVSFSSEIAAPSERADPDGNRFRLVPAGYDGIAGARVELVTSHRDAYRWFWSHVMGLPSVSPDIFLCGNSGIILAEERKVERFSGWRAPGWRYLTIQVMDCFAEHAAILRRGGEEGQPPMQAGPGVRYSFVRDPDGTFIELSERASLTGRRY